MSDAETTQEEVVDDPNAIKPMIFQSKFKGNHTIVMRSTTWDVIPGLQRPKLVPQLVATFGGPQRLFNSTLAMKENHWSQEDHDAIVTWLFEHPRYMLDFFPGPKQQENIPEKYRNIRRKDSGPRTCTQIFIEGDDISRCPEPVTAGRAYCKTHDPDRQVITKGLGTTVG